MTLSVAVSTAHAADPRVAVLPSSGAAAGERSAVDEALRAAVSDLSDVDQVPSPALDLEAVQLAIDCVGESARCLGEVASRTDSDILVAPLLRKADGAVELRILYFDARQRERRSAKRRADGERVDRELLAAIPAMVREVFGREAAEVGDASPVVPAVEDSEVEEASQDATELDATEEVSGDTQTYDEGDPGADLPQGPLFLAIGSALLIGGGLVVGAAAQGTEDEYAGLMVQTMEQAEQADALRERGEREALIATGLIGAGAAALAVSAVWFVLELQSDADGAAFEPVLGPSHAGLRLRGAWEGL